MITFIALSGFLGAGKTTTMAAGARLLEASGRRAALITNDQGQSLVDTQVARTAGVDVGEVTGGCFCCRFEDLLDVSRELISHGVDTIIAEAVGSCTDLQATVVRPLRAYYGSEFTVAPLTTVVDPLRLIEFGGSMDLSDAASDLSYLFGRQLEEADLLAVNKLDLLSPGQVATVLQQLAALAPHARLVPYSAHSGIGLDALVEAWSGSAPAARDLTVDYDRYASAEAALGWLNRSLVIESSGDGVPPKQWAIAMLSHLSALGAQRGWVTGHAKVGLESASGLTKVSLTESGAAPSVDVAVTGLEPCAEAAVNARIACTPAQLDAAVDEAIARADALCGTTSRASQAVPAFQPGYPRPVHRLAAAS